MRLGRRYRFSASHRLHTARLSEEENRRIYGKCNNPFGHGHDYVLELVIEGRPDPESGLLAPLERLDDYVHEKVLAGFDHKDLNRDVPVFRSLPPTTENLAQEIRRRLEQDWAETFGAPRLAKVILRETANNVIEW